MGKDWESQTIDIHTRQLMGERPKRWAGGCRVLRGGAFSYGFGMCGVPLALGTILYRYGNIGFRVVMHP